MSIGDYMTKTKIYEINPKEAINRIENSLLLKDMGKVFINNYLDFVDKSTLKGYMRNEDTKKSNGDKLYVRYLVGKMNHSDIELVLSRTMKISAWSKPESSLIIGLKYNGPGLVITENTKKVPGLLRLFSQESFRSIKDIKENYDAKYYCTFEGISSNGRTWNFPVAHTDIRDSKAADLIKEFSRRIAKDASYITLRI